MQYTISKGEELMRRIATTVAAAAASGVLALGMAAPASAAAAPGGGQTQWIGSCSYFVDYTTKRISGYCNGGNGAKFRAWLECKGPLPWTYVVVGDWEWAGGDVASTAKCGGNIVDAGVDTYDPEPV
jgi:hypothetical protein